MTALSGSAPPTRNDRDFERIYLDHYDFLVSIAVRKFGIPAADAGPLVNDVFVSFLKPERQVHDVHAWLLGAICHASRYYWRQRGRGGETVELDELFEREDPMSHDIRDTLPDVLAARAMLDSLPPRYRYILRLRFYDGCSIAEIAETLGVKPKYAQKLVTKCLRRAEKNYRAKGEKR